MLSEFRAFLTGSNALALAIGVIIGAALGAVVTSLVEDIIMPPIGVLLGGVDFSALAIPLGDSGAAIRWGEFLNALITFVIVGFVVFWLGKTLIKPAPAAATQTCPYCRETVVAEATKCKYCGSTLGGATGA